MLHRVLAFLKFYWSAVTRYQLHSPFLFEMATAVLEDGRWYYAFRDVERLRREMLHSAAVLEVTDHGTGGVRQRTYRRALRRIVARSASAPHQGRRLFRLANWLAPDALLEMGSSVGIGTAYLASARRTARVVSLEGCPQTAAVAAQNLDILGLRQVELLPGEFDSTLLPALQALRQVDFFYFDGNHRPEPTLRYFETCLPFASAKAAFVFDDVHWSAEMEQAWKSIQQHPRVTLTVDFFDFSVAFINPDFREKQQIAVVPARWKIWRFW